MPVLSNMRPLKSLPHSSSKTKSNKDIKRNVIITLRFIIKVFQYLIIPKIISS